MAEIPTTFFSAMLLAMSAFSFFWCIYSMYNLYKHRQNAYFVKRGPILLFSFIAASATLICIIFPLLFIFHIFSIVDEEIQLLWYTSCIIISNGATSILFTRIFLQYINIRRSEDSADWKHQIDKNYTTWVLKYFHILGNPNKLLLIVGIVFIIDLMFSIAVIITDKVTNANDNNNNNDNSSNSTLNLVFTVLLCIVASWVIKCIIIGYCIYQSKGFFDHWHIAHEFKWLFYIVSLVVFGLCTTLLLSFLNVVNGLYPIFWASGFLFMFWYDSCWYISVLLVTKLCTDHDSEFEQLDQTSARERSTDDTNRLWQTFQSEQGYDKFFKHLQREFSFENILFVTILLQWQSLLIENKVFEDNCKDSDSSEFIILKGINVPKNVPMSPIIARAKNAFESKKSNLNFNVHVRKGNNIKNINKNNTCIFDTLFVTAFEEIYHEYISANRAPFEINISSHLRDLLKQDYLYIANKKLQLKQNNNDGLIIQDFQTFSQMWLHLNCACMSVSELLFFSMVRFKE